MRGWVKAFWMPHEDNEQADMLSKTSLEMWDFGIRPEVAATMFLHFFRPKLDIFASRMFHVCEDYYAWGSDFKAVRANAFLVPTWSDYSYAFPPPLLIAKTLAKILIITPNWMAIPWWDRLMAMALREPMRLGKLRTSCIARTGATLPRLGMIVATMVWGKGGTHTVSKDAGQ